MPRSWHIHKEVTLDIPVNHLWPAAMQWERLTTLTHSPRSHLLPTTQDNGQVYLSGSTQVGPYTLRWLEKPDEWIRNRFYQHEHYFLAGPARATIMRIDFKPISAEQTSVEFAGELIPRHILGALMALGMKSGYIAPLEKAYQAFASNYILRQPDLYPPLPSPQLDQAQLTRLSEVLHDQFKLMLPHLQKHLLTAPDGEVVKMRPFVLADRWGFPRTEVLRLFLHATHAGLLDFDWVILCPNCRLDKLFTQANSSLRLVHPSIHCETCAIDYQVDFDRHVELRFRVNPRVRVTDNSTHCGSVMTSLSHIIMQLRVLPHVQRTIPLLNYNFQPGLYRLRTLPGTLESQLEISWHNNQYLLDLEQQQEENIALSWQIVNQSLNINNHTDREMMIVLEEIPWSQSDAVTAAYVASLQEFRDLYPSEVLSPGVSLSIKNQTILFTELQNTTTIYGLLGDARTYSVVREHFELLTNIISVQHGALVKTIGDAVMATFVHAVDALKAALAMQVAIKVLNKEHPELTGVSLGLKIGLHAGSCLAVNSNELLDYFGSTVNIAARVQGLSQEGEIIYTQAIATEPEVSTMLASSGLVPHEFTGELRGIQRNFTLYRLIAPSPETMIPQ